VTTIGIDEKVSQQVRWLDPCTGSDARKRALAEDVLSDSAEAARLDPKALMALLEG
jgi:hypothetical protein